MAGATQAGAAGPGATDRAPGSQPGGGEAEDRRVRYFHGTRAPLPAGSMLRPGFRSNHRPELTVLLAGGEAVPHVYEVEPTGPFEDDPNVTDQKFPGNPTQSYRSSAPLLILGEVEGWTRLTADETQLWRERLARLTTDPEARIIN